MKKLTFCLQAVLLVLTGAVLLSGCTSTIGHGKKFDTANVKNIKKGVTTKGDILQMLSQPNSKTINSGKESWVYSYQKTKASYVPFFVGLVGTSAQSEGSSLNLVFDKDVLRECTFSYNSGSTKSRSLLYGLDTETTAPTTQVTEPCGD